MAEVITADLLGTVVFSVIKSIIAALLTAAFLAAALGKINGQIDLLTVYHRNEGIIKRFKNLYRVYLWVTALVFIALMLTFQENIEIGLETLKTISLYFIAAGGLVLIVRIMATTSLGVWDDKNPWDNTERIKEMLASILYILSIYVILKMSDLAYDFGVVDVVNIANWATYPNQLPPALGLVPIGWFLIMPAILASFGEFLRWLIFRCSDKEIHTVIDSD